MSDSPLIDLIRQQGPILPSHVPAYIAKSLLFASAMLSDLRSRGLVKLSNLRVGGSPLYFLSGQEPMLEKFLPKLHEKDQQTASLLQNTKLLRDDAQTSLVRVGLRTIKDFAIPFSIQNEGKEVLFWRWHSCPQEEATILAEKTLVAVIPPVQPAVELVIPAHPSTIPQSSKIIDAVTEPPKAKQVQRSKAKPKINRQEKLPIPRMPEPIVQEVPTHPNQIDPLCAQDAWYKKLEKFFMAKNCMIHSVKLIKKNSEVEGRIFMQTAFGSVPYYFRAKNKQKISDSDLAVALASASASHLPCIFLGGGSLSKAAEDLRKSYPSIIIEQV